MCIYLKIHKLLAKIPVDVQSSMGNKILPSWSLTFRGKVIC